MRLLRRIAIVFVALCLVLLIIGLVLPRTWHVERTIVINAAPERIFPQIANPRRWQDWSVWNKQMDPQVRYTYEGPESGVGAKWSWLGPKMGNGRMEMTFAEPRQGIRVDEAIESAQVNAHGSILFTPEGPNTRVTWVDEGTLPPVLGGFFRSSINDMLNENFEAGLIKLKALVEVLPKLASELPPVPTPAPVAADAGAN